VSDLPPEVNGHLPVSQPNLQAIREGMRESIENGLDSCARQDISGLSIAGKTGTAEYPELIDPTRTDYDPNNIRMRSHSWFVGFAPYEKPEIEVLALVEGSGDLNDGSATIAVPAVTEIMQAYYHVTPPPASLGPVPPYNLPCH